MGEVFSLKHIGRNWGIALMIAALFGMLTQEIFGVTYDAHVPDGEIDCFGMKCWSFSALYHTVYPIEDQSLY
jgi:DNA-binding XRE family transcriptional regulator